METYIKTVLESLKEDNLNIPELREFLERELRECWKARDGEIERLKGLVRDAFFSTPQLNTHWQQFKKENSL